MYDADGDQVDTEDEDHPNNSYDDNIKSDNDDGAGIFSISREDYDTLADEHKEERTLSEVRTRRTEDNNVS